MNFIEHKDNIHIWVLAPFLETDDEYLQFYYDYTQSIAEYTKVFEGINCSWTWVNVTMQNIEKVIEDIHAQTTKINIALNLCDGDEINGTPGISVIEALKKNNIIYTGADAFFYNITTSKIPMKAAFDKHAVPIPAYALVNDENTLDTIFETIGKTVIVKPAVSGGSMGLMAKNVVENKTDLLNIVAEIKKGYRGWKLDVDGIFAETFISGREFTTFIVGSHYDDKNLIFYNPVERVFHASLPDKEQFLSFDRLWETYDNETAMPNEEYVYNYAAPEKELYESLKKISIDAYKAVAGMGYGRIDIRQDKATKKMYILEVNAQSGISEDEDYTSIGAILRLSNKTFTSLVIEIIQDGINRHQKKQQSLIS
jgi:D-alanine-D-alanine ligase